MRIAQRAAVTTVAAGAALVMLAGPAMAHECVNVSRSGQANAKVAENSKAWATFDLSSVGIETYEDLFGFFATDGRTMFGLPAMTGDEATQAANLAQMVATADAQDIPLSYLVNDASMLAHKAPQKVLSDGKGIDHFTQPLVAIYLTFYNAPAA